MLKLALSRFKSSRALLVKLREQSETIDRLEIDLRRLSLKVNELATDLERLSDRLCATQGRLLGGKRKPRAPEQLDLESIPRGDKSALRAFFLRNPPKDDTEH